MTIGYDIYNGAFSIVSKHDFDDQFFLLATVLLYYCKLVKLTAVHWTLTLFAASNLEKHNLQSNAKNSRQKFIILFYKCGFSNTDNRNTVVVSCQLKWKN
jgi:hypothetical protein